MRVDHTGMVREFIGWSRNNIKTCRTNFSKGSTAGINLRKFQYISQVYISVTWVEAKQERNPDFALSRIFSSI